MKTADFYSKKIGKFLMKHTDREAVDGKVKQETLTNQIKGVTHVLKVLYTIKAKSSEKRIITPNHN